MSISSISSRLKKCSFCPNPAKWEEVYEDHPGTTRYCSSDHNGVFCAVERERLEQLRRDLNDEDFPILDKEDFNP